MKKKLKKNTCFIIVLLAFIIGAYLFHLKFNIIGNELQNEVTSIIKEKIKTNKKFVGNNRLSGNESIKIVQSSQEGLLKVFGGQIITNEQPITFMITFKKHPLFDLYMYDKFTYSVKSSDSDYIILFSSYGFVNYDSKINYENCKIFIEKKPSYKKILPPPLVGIVIYTILFNKKKKIISKNLFI